MSFKLPLPPIGSIASSPGIEDHKPRIKDLKPPLFVQHCHDRYFNVPAYMRHYKWCYAIPGSQPPRLYLNTYVWALQGFSSEYLLGRIVKIEAKGSGQLTYTLCIQRPARVDQLVDSDLRDFNASDLAVLEAVSEKVVFIGIYAMHCLTGQIIPAGEL